MVRRRQRRGSAAKREKAAQHSNDVDHQNSFTPSLGNIRNPNLRQRCLKWVAGFAIWHVLVANLIGRRRYPHISIVSAEPPYVAPPTRIVDSWGFEKQHCLLFVYRPPPSSPCLPPVQLTSMRMHTFFAAAFVAIVSAHGTHGGGAHAGNYGEEARTDYPNWMTRHMAGTQRTHERFAARERSALTTCHIQC